MKLQANTIYTTDEIAQWFGITKKGFLNARENKLKELAKHCDFTQPKRGKYLVESVKVAKYDPTLIKTYSKTYLTVKNHLPNYLLSIDTNINVGTKINREIFNNHYSDEYIAGIVGQIIIDNPEEYPYQKAVGFKKGENGFATFRLFNQHEKEIYYEIIKEYVSELADDKSKSMQQAIDDRETGKISNSQFYKMNFDIKDNFSFNELHYRLRKKLNLTDEQYANRLRNFEDQIPEGDFNWDEAR